MRVLYNGKAEKYLVEDKYARSISPRLQVFAPQPLQHKLKVFVGGIGEPQNIDGKNFFLIVGSFEFTYKCTTSSCVGLLHKIPALFRSKN
jgi:hypothetical protein